MNIYRLRLLTSCTLCRIFVELQSSGGSLCSKCMVSFASALNLLPAQPNAPIVEASAMLGLLSLQELRSHQLLACAHHACQRTCHRPCQRMTQHSHTQCRRCAQRYSRRKSSTAKQALHRDHTEGEGGSPSIILKGGNAALLMLKYDPVMLTCMISL